MSSKKEFLRVSEVAIQLRKSRTTIYKWIYAGRINAININKSGFMIPKSEVDNLLKKSKFNPLV